MVGMLEGQVAVVTASAGAGIGLATARRFAEEGANVVISDVHERRIAETVNTLKKDFGRDFLGVVADVSNVEQVNAMIATTVERLGKIDILVNNAARNSLSPIVDMTDDNWNLVIGVTLTGTFNCTRAVLPHMIRRGTGKIVNVTSVAGWLGGANGAHYAAAKAGVMAFTRASAEEVTRSGVRVNAVAVSFSPNPFLERIYSPEQLKAMAEHALMGRGAEPREIANVIVFLCSDLASYVSGEVYSVSAQHP